MTLGGLGTQPAWGSTGDMVQGLSETRVAPQGDDAIPHTEGAPWTVDALGYAKKALSCVTDSGSGCSNRMR